MKKIIFTALLIMSIKNAFADNFQVIYNEGNNKLFASYCSYRILDGSSRQIAQGYTDKYGRIVANLKKSNYVCEVIYKGKTYRRAITIDNSKNMKEILIA